MKLTKLTHTRTIHPVKSPLILNWMTYKDYPETMIADFNISKSFFYWTHLDRIKGFIEFKWKLLSKQATAESIQLAQLFCFWISTSYHNACFVYRGENFPYLIKIRSPLSTFICIPVHRIRAFPPFLKKSRKIWKTFFDRISSQSFLIMVKYVFSLCIFVGVWGGWDMCVCICNYMQRRTYNNIHCTQVY